MAKDARQVELTPDDSLQGLQFEQGFYAYDVTGVAAGTAIEVEIRFHQPGDEPFAATRYYKYGPTPDNDSDHWYDFGLDGATGATFAGSTVSLRLVDGGRGDADRAANGVIVDPGGPAVDNRVDPDSVTPTDAGVGAIGPNALILMTLIAIWARVRPRVGGSRLGNRTAARHLE